MVEVLIVLAVDTKESMRLRQLGRITEEETTEVEEAIGEEQEEEVGGEVILLLLITQGLSQPIVVARVQMPLEEEEEVVVVALDLSEDQEVWIRLDLPAVFLASAHSLLLGSSTHIAYGI